MSTIFFFRGFNTYGDDALRFGPFNLGDSHRELAPRFEKKGFRFFSIPGCGRGTLDEQLATCHKFLRDRVLDFGRDWAVENERAPKGQKFSAPVHFLGHSAGGVVARGLAHRLLSQPIEGVSLKTVTTMNSPNRGSNLARYLTSKADHPLLYRALRIVRYDIREKMQAFGLWRPELIQAFNQAHPDRPDVKYASIVSSTHIAELPAVLRIIQPSAEHRSEWTDGIVEKESQPWGDILLETQLDHGAVLGFRTVLSRARHLQNRQRFEEMVTRLVTHMKAIE